MISSNIENQELSHLNKPINISINSNYPPAVAFSEVTRHTILVPKEEFTNLSTASALEVRNEIIEEIKVVSNIQKAEKQLIVLDEVAVKRPEFIETAIGGLTPSQAERLEIAQRNSEVLNQDWSTPKVDDDFIKKAILAVNDVYSNQTHGPKVFVSAGKTEANLTQEQFLENQKNEKITALGQALVSANGLTGQIEISNGLILTNEHHIEVRRYLEGVPQEDGTLDLTNGTFKINLKENSGVIQAQLINGYGIIEGQGSVAVSDLVATKSNKSKITLRPVDNPGRGGRVSSAYNKKRDGSQRVVAANSNLPFAIKPDGKVKNDSIVPTSDVYLIASAKDHNNTSLLTSMNEAFDLKLLPTAALKTLQEIFNEQGDHIRFDGEDILLMGKVVLGGQPVRGAKVQIDVAASPYYFGDLELPDANKTETSDNGLFAFIVKQSGWNEIEVLTKEGIRFAVNVFVSEQSVNQVIASVPRTTKQTKVRVFDAFSGEPETASLVFQQMSGKYDVVSEEQELLIPTTAGLTFVDLTGANGSADARHFYTHLKDSLHLPTIKKSWLQQIAMNLKVESKHGTATTIGFVHDENFEILSQASGQIVYFNSVGEVTDSGLAGGGFIIFNQEPFSYNYTVSSLETAKIINRISINEPGLISIHQFSFR